MILYHGSTVEVPHPDPARARKNLDFGQGFYLTSHRSQAERWAKRKAMLEDASAVVNEYEFAERALENFAVLRFDESDADWVKFVCDCRRGGNAYQKYDVIIGCVANDKVYEAVNMYFRGYWDIDTTLKALKYYDKNDQYCFVSQAAVDALLSFRRAYETGR
ncbi:DUF3990 domain-containing protein [Adlercreutzia sp. ZJ473]|uniref:DUF3990 domain-containing protein n=1 Tax=Adlercreutzia sp. ZJ473 TaxID=2722822 RepID=UPI001551D11D|nr:DUF3990 domain-containing protein [Adlercreutzia sp. ZJ473]